MAYNHKNRLLRIIKIQEITVEHTRNGVSQEHVYRSYIAPAFAISRRTYYKYLATNAKKELSQKSYSTH
ncbi:hypothetical protein [Alkaliflexus imshenetskii]|uniref:hypothetical protein n=1 Tax=Alkaliflexus imshenetskii TaxID=286730 RepID=UPI0004795FE0|nr:hypothetical protein [Alkaliflexus imshenetskii]